VGGELRRCALVPYICAEVRSDVGTISWHPGRMRKCTEKTGSFIKYTTPFSERFRSAHICSVFVACKKKLVVLPLGDKKNGLAQFLANVSLLHLVSSQYFHLPINGMFYRTRKKCVKPYSSILYCRCTKDIKSSFSAKHQTQNMTLRMSIW